MKTKNIRTPIPQNEIYKLRKYLNFTINNNSSNSSPEPMSINTNLVATTESSLQAAPTAEISSKFSEISITAKPTAHPPILPPSPTPPPTNMPVDEIPLPIQPPQSLASPELKMILDPPPPPPSSPIKFPISRVRVLPSGFVERLPASTISKNQLAKLRKNKNKKFMKRNISHIPPLNSLKFTVPPVVGRKPHIITNYNNLNPNWPTQNNQNQFSVPRTQAPPQNTIVTNTMVPIVYLPNNLLPLFNVQPIHSIFAAGLSHPAN
uniref:Uncharacterized protein n=1 Tax=Meloidogyne enterolobii TaxID=390850 RepID=A0A6V7XJG1_MELEN|nr:unnamed protein product [Meloidogyne enterolobii]